VCFVAGHLLSQNISQDKEDLSDILSLTYIGLHVAYPLFLSISDGTWILTRNIFEKKKTQISNFTENYSGGNSVPCEQTD
jgi:hypothetical protein